MILTDQIANYIKNKHIGKTVYIGESIKKTVNKRIIDIIKSGLNETNDITKAEVLVENNVNEYCCPVIFSNGSNAVPSEYKIKEISKPLDVFLYARKKVVTENNLYINNKNDDLFKLAVKKRRAKKSKPISEIFGKSKSKKLLIVGGGESWQDIDYDKLADNIKVMVVNYNFNIKADYLVWHDKKVGANLDVVTFKDRRKVIGFERNECRICDYTYNWEDIIETHHTGATAIQLAGKMGFKEIYLIGFDYKQNSLGLDQTYKKDRNDYYDHKKCNMFVEDFNNFKAERTYNLNKDSNLKKLPYADIGELYVTSSK